MPTDTIPILEFDPSPTAIIEPRKVLAELDVPQHCVLCFFQDVIASVCHEGKARHITDLISEVGKNPVYELTVDGRPLLVCHPGVGAPLAAGFLEELIAIGANKFIACGGAGVLNSELAVGHVVVPSSAVRDEGTSYHYLPPSREVSASPEGIDAIERTLQKDRCQYIVAKTWTTDAIYRETKEKIRRRREEGCVTVEMEAAAFFAVAQFRKVTFAQLLYGGDDVGSDEWDSRHWNSRTPIREKLFWLAVESCLAISPG